MTLPADLDGAVLDSAPDAVLVLALDGIIVGVNRQALRLFGGEPGDLVGRPVETVLVEAAVDVHGRCRDRVTWSRLSRIATDDVKLMALRRDGIHVAAEVSLCWLQGCDPPLVAVCVRDVSDRVSAEAELRLAQEQFRSAFDDAAIGMALVAPDGTWLKVNRALCDIVGYPEAELLGRRFQDITHPDDLDAALGLLRQVLDGRIPSCRLFSRYIHRLGHVISIRLSASLVQDAEGRPLHLVSQIEDVTHERTVEDALRESQRRLQAVLDNIPAGLSLRDLSGRYLMVNEYIARSLDTVPEALLGVDPSGHLDEATRDQMRAEDMQLVSSRRPMVTATRVPHPDGTHHDYHVVRYPLVDQDGRVTGIGAFSLDVTDQRRTEHARAEALEELAEAQRLAAIGSWRWDPVSDVATWSDEMYRIFGRDPGEGPAAGEAFFAYVHPDDRERLAAGYAQTFGGGPSFVLDYRIVRSDGTERIIHAIGRENALHPGTYLGTVQDVTEMRVAMRRQEAAEERFRSAFESAPIGMAITDLKGRYERVNPAFCELTGYTCGELLSRSIQDVTHPDDRARDWEILALLTDGQLAQFDREKRYVHADGRTVWVSVHVTLLRVDNRAAQLLIQVLDITERRQRDEQLQHLAVHDELTGLLNRRGFEKVLAQHLAHVRRHGDRGALLLLDLDNFKAVNDTLGHAAGDVLLASVASVLRRGLRGTDVAGRLGGDEFAVLSPDADRHRVRRIAENLVRESAGCACAVADRGAYVTASVGAVALGHTFATAADALAAADAAMYEAKASGRNRSTIRGFG